MGAPTAQGASVKVTFRNDKLRKLTKEAEEFRLMEVQVGYYDPTAQYEDGTPVASVAAWHEFGTQNMPQRSFIRSALKENKNDLARFNGAAMKEMIVGKATAKKTATKIAHAVAKVVYRKLVTASSWAVPLALGTVRAKGHSRVLVDTEFLRNELSWRVLSRGQVIAEGKARNARVSI